MSSALASDRSIIGCGPSLEQLFPSMRAVPLSYSWVQWSSFMGGGLWLTDQFLGCSDWPKQWELKWSWPIRMPLWAAKNGNGGNILFSFLALELWERATYLSGSFKDTQYNEGQEKQKQKEPRIQSLHWAALLPEVVLLSGSCSTPESPFCL